MRKIIYFTIFALIISCSADKPSTNSSGAEITKFTIIQDQNRTFDNIQVNEVLNYKISIDNFDTDPNVTYVLKPISIDARKHQIKNIDYLFQQKIIAPNNPNSYQLETKDSIKIKSKYSDFFLKILKPGNFQHIYSLRKMIGNKYEEISVEKNVLFSAVKINLRYIQTSRGCGFLGWSTCYDRTYKISINDGDEQFDDYLTTGNGKTHIFETVHNGELFIGGNITSSNSEVDFSMGHQGINSNNPPHSSNILDELKIVQTQANGSFNNIRYRNINY